MMMSNDHKLNRLAVLSKACKHWTIYLSSDTAQNLTVEYCL